MALTKVSYSMIEGAYINALDYGADSTGAFNSATALQNAINAAAGLPVYVPAGTYRIDTQLTYNTATALAPGLKLIGDGIGKTIFDSRVAGAAMLSINGGDNYTFQLGGYLSDFSIIASTAPINADGIEMRSVWHCDVDRVSIKGLARYGFRVYSTVAPGDPDSSAYVNFRNCRSDDNGYGFRMTSAAASIGISFITIENCSISNNTLIGVSLSNVNVICIQRCGIIGNTEGITQLPNGVGNQFIFIDDNEFGNGNTNHNCWIGGVYSGSFNRNRVVQNNGETGEYGLILGDGSLDVTDFECVGNIFRIDASINPFTAFWVKANTTHIRIEDTQFTVFGAAGQTKYNLATALVRLRENGKSWNNFVKVYESEPITSYAPNLNDGELHRVRVNATGAFTIGNPTNSAAGKILQLVIINASGGSITVSFGSDFVDGGYTDPSNNNRSTAQFVYDVTSVKWVQIGAWANNIS
jgi:hypothetical protein